MLPGHVPSLAAPRAGCSKRRPPKLRRLDVKVDQPAAPLLRRAALRRWERASGAAELVRRPLRSMVLSPAYWMIAGVYAATYATAKTHAAQLASDLASWRTSPGAPKPPSRGSPVGVAPTSLSRSL